MPFFSYKSFKPQLHDGVYVAEGAMVIGQVTLSQNVNIWFNSVIRGDINTIFIGKNTNIQDLSVIHVDKLNNVKIGENVTVGHKVTLHGCHIGDGCLIGMGSTILDGAKIGASTLVGAGSLVPPGKVFPEGVLVMGSPAKVVRELTDEEKTWINNHYKSYLKTKDEYLGPDVHPLGDLLR